MGIYGDIPEGTQMSEIPGEYLIVRFVGEYQMVRAL